MYIAKDIDTDKAFKAIGEARECQERASFLRMEKEKAFMDGIRKGLDIAESLFECSNYEKSEGGTYVDGVCDTIYELGKEFDVATQDIRDNISSVDEACNLLADRIREEAEAVKAGDA